MEQKEVTEDLSSQLPETKKLRACLCAVGRAGRDRGPDLETRILCTWKHGATAI